MAILHPIRILDEPVGSGTGFGMTIIIVAGVCALVSSLLTILAIFLQARNYRKPLLQRHVVRILVLVPIFSAACWASLYSLRAAFWLKPLRDVYEAFTIYTFFQLMVNFLGGERSLMVMMHGRPPVSQFWPLSYCLQKVDISDPHTFLRIKRGILQYAWVQLFLALVTEIMKATGTFREGVIALDSGYFWTGLIYNVSISWSLYELAMFWVCLSDELAPFRPMPKFLCIKGIVFMSWWQGFFLSIMVFAGAIPDIEGYTADNLAAAIQDALVCFEMPLFAIAHWYAFSWKDYVDNTISDARMPMRFAFRDAFGPRDLIEDAKETFSGRKYEYRQFDAEDNVIAHEESSSRRARMKEGMRYERDGRGKYWIPSSGERESKQPLLSRLADSRARTMSPGGTQRSEGSRSDSQAREYGTSLQPEEPELDAEEERLYSNARALEFGDWNYPVVNTHYASHEDGLRAEPNLLSQSTNRAILQPGPENRRRRKSRIREIQNEVHQAGSSSSQHRGSSSSGGDTSSHTTKGKEKLKSLPLVGNLVRQPSSSSSNSASSQLVDLVVEDKEAREVEKVRARKEGGPGWNGIEQKHFIKTFPGEEEAEEVRQGFNPDRPEKKITDETHVLTEDDSVDDGMKAVSEEEGQDQMGRKQPWEERRYGGGSGSSSPFRDERDAWGGSGKEGGSSS